MPIYLAECNCDLTIIRLTGSDEIRRHLENLGFIPGEVVQVVSKVNDNVIIKIKGISMAVSHELARRIMV